MAREIGQPHSSSAAGAASAPASPSAAPSVPLLSVRDIIKRFPGIVANDAISLDFHAGEIHVILGENGAGKSTLIGILAGMQQPDSGAILLDGRAVQIRTPRQALDFGIGTVFQHVLLVPSLSVLDNLMLGGPWWQKLARTAARRRFADLSALLGMTFDADARLDSLSLGEQQQVEIMRALWRDARVLILDEPTSMLTPQGVKDLAQVLKRLRDNNVAIILVTHKLAEAHELGDRITVLRQGKCIGSISPNEHSALGEAEMTDLVVAMMFGAPDRLAGDERAILLGRGETLDRVSISRTGMSRAGTPRLWVDGVSSAPGQGAHALRDISFEVWPGEIFGIAGVDGNGQKQLAGVLAGQLRSVGGRIAVDGRDVTLGDVPARRQAGISYVTDDRLGEGSVGSLPIALNLLLKDVGRAPFWRRGVADQSRIDAFARALVARHDIRTPSIWTPLAKLSGGNIQKVLLARELADGGVADARVIIFNKPTHGLDLHNARLAHDRMRASAAAGSSIVLLSSDLDELLTLSDRIAVLSRGRLVGTVDNGPGAAAIVGRLMTGSQAA